MPYADHAQIIPVVAGDRTVRIFFPKSVSGRHDCLRQQPRQLDAASDGELRDGECAVRREAKVRMKHLVRIVGHWALLLHIYISMAGFTLVLLFAITGLTLNHEDFGLSQPKVTTSTIVLTADVLERPDRTALGQRLRDLLGIRSPLTDYREDPEQIQLTFAAPGHRTVVTVNRAQRTGALETETRGLLGRLDDLHKGFDSGPTWSWIIDLAAVLLTLSALTGMVTLVAFRARRRSGFVVALLGIVSIVALYLIWVPQ